MVQVPVYVAVMNLLSDLIGWDKIIPDGLPGAPPNDYEEIEDYEEEEEEWED